MTRRLLDTTVFIDYRRGDLGAREVLEGLFDQRDTALYSPITVFELWLGKMADDEEMTYRALLAVFGEAPVTSTIAQRAASWMVQLQGRVREEVARDAIIAATAVEHGAEIVSRNERDFQRFNVNVSRY